MFIPRDERLSGTALISRSRAALSLHTMISLQPSDVGHVLHHPDTHRPWSKWSEDQTLHIVAPYINPFRWRTRRELFNDFLRHMRNTPNVVLYPVEVAFGDRPFEVTGEHENDIQLRTTHEMWLKERCINLGAARFPPGYKYGGYVDGDFNFTRHDWALEAIQMLQHHEFVQLFSSYTDLTGETETSWRGHRPYRLSSSFAWNYLHPDEFLHMRLELRRKNLALSDDSYYAPMAPSKEFPFGFPPGATGGGWAWRRSAFNTVGGMLDICILGSGDWHQAFGLIEAINVAAEMKRCTKPYVNAVLQWQSRASKLTRNIGCVDQHAVHHFHGSKSRRAYGERWHILRKHSFDPATDLTPDDQMLWQLTGNKPRLRDDLRRYFIERCESDPNLYGGERPII